MSRINGEKARAGIARKRRTAQREKDREARAVIVGAIAAQPKAEAKPVKAEAKPAKAEAKPAAKPEAAPAPKKAKTKVQEAN